MMTIIPVSSKLRDIYSRTPIDRANSVVIDPFAFLKYNPLWRRIIWNGAGAYGELYRSCQDPIQNLPRHSVENWSNIVYCDYKLFRFSVITPAQRLCLDSWLALDSTVTRILHVSLDDYDFPVKHQIATLANLQWQGDLALQIIDHTDKGYDYRCLYELFDQSKLAAFEYHHQTARASFLVDLSIPHAAEFTIVPYSGVHSLS